MIAIQTGNIPNYAPEYSLGYGILDWSERYIVQPDGENAGDPWRFTPEQMRFILWFYAVDEKGRWLYRSGSLRRSKGWGKSPLLAALAIIEMIGPCRFDRWEVINGQKIPIGKPVPIPWVQIAATSYDQTENTLTAVRGMLAASKAVEDYGLDITKTMVQFRDGRPGKIEPVTANSTTLEGGRPTFVVLDETHLFFESNGGHKVARVISRNLGKSAGGSARFCESTNAYNPNQDSIAQQTHEAVQVGAKDILYDCVEASPVDPDWNIKDPANEPKLRELLKEAYGDSHWIDLDRIVGEIYDPRVPPGEAFRFYLNNVMESADTWIPKNVWVECKDTDDPIRKKDQIAIGFDGSLYDDATALVGCRLRDGKLFRLGHWEKGENDGDDWEVPVAEVNATLHKAFKDYRVAWVYCDPYLWQDVIDRWAQEYGRNIVYKFATNRPKPMYEALERFHTAAFSGQLRHDGDPHIQRHILNAVKKEDGNGRYILAKEKPKSPKKIDLAMAAVLAYEARGDALNDGRLKTKGRILTQ